jgi:hypothetical protein
MMMLILEGLRLDLSTKHTIPSILSLKSSKKSLPTVMSKVAHVSRSHASLQEVYEVLKNIFNYSYIAMGNNVMIIFR